MAAVVLINPNTNEAITATMVAIARSAAPPALTIRGVTAHFGTALITTENELATAANAVQALVPELSGHIAGVIVAAFGDPGLAELRQQLAVPVIGIGEAGLLEAASKRERFVVVTTTSHLAARIDRYAEALGLSGYAGVVITPGDPVALTTDPTCLIEALAAATARAIHERHADAVVIGGGPLGDAARALQTRFSIPIVEPIPAAVRQLAASLRLTTTHA